MISSKEKSEEMNADKLILEKIFSKSHIHTIYILFVNLCKENDYKLTRSVLFDLFRQLSQITNIKYDEEKIDLLHLQIDIDKDGIINFDDFLLFISSLMKLTYNELYYKKGINLLSSLSITSDRQLFIDIISNLFSNILNYIGDNTNSGNINNNNLNPFTYYDLSLKFLPFYKFYCGYKNGINMSNYYNSQKKFNEFNEMIINFTNVNFITELQNLLNSQSTNEYYKGLSLFKKSIKPLNFINNELLIVFYNKNIFIFLSVILKANLLNKILMIFDIINNKNNVQNNVISPDVIYTFLVIIRRILNIYVMLNETFCYCGGGDKKFLYHFIKDQQQNFNELSIFINNKILNPLSNNYNYFYNIFDLKNKKSNSIEIKVKYIMYQLILLTSKIKYEYYLYFINCTNYFEWLINDIKGNINIKNTDTNFVDYITIENVVYNCINIIDITLRYENNILNDNEYNNKALFIRNIYLKILYMINSIQDIIFSNQKNNLSFLDSKNNNNIKINDNIALKSKFLCLLGLLNSIEIEPNNMNSGIIEEFDNRKFILQIYNEDFKLKNKELTLPFCFYLKSLIINNKKILSIISELEIVNNLYNYYSENISATYCTFSSFFDFCELILNYTDSKILINNSNIINELIIIMTKMMRDNSNNKLIEDFEVKNRIIDLLSRITNLNDVCINEKIINMQSIFEIIISYMNDNFYYIEEINYLNKKGIVFNILLLENGLKIINNILYTNSNSYQKIMENFTLPNLENLTNIFDKISLLWEIDDKINIDLSEEIIKNKYVFDKYKEIPNKNILIQILSIFDNLISLKEKIIISNIKVNYEEVFNYINDIDINMRLKLRDLKITSDGMQNLPILTLYTQTEEEFEEKRNSIFTAEIEGITFYNVLNAIKEGYQSDLELFYIINKDNNNITRSIKTEKDFEDFINELLKIYEKQPIKDNHIEANLKVKLKQKKPKVKRNCINCQKEIEVELDIDEKKLEEMNDLSNIENINNFNKLINESNQLCKDCEKFILEEAKNKINIENSLNNLSRINMSGLNNISGNNTYQNILAKNSLQNDIINGNNSILSNSLFNRTNNTVIGLNNNPNNISNLNNINNGNTILGLNTTNISSINPTTPRRDNTMFANNLLNSTNINNTFSSNLTNYKVLRTNYYQ